MHRVLEPEAFSKFLEEFNKLDKYSFREGYVIDKEMGITYPPYPKGLQAGAILSTFSHLSDCVESEPDKIFLQQRSNELVYGFLSFMKRRWPNTIRHKIRVSKHEKVLGEWFRAAYALCEGTASYIPLKNSDSRIGVDGAAFFHHCAKDLAEGNGIVSLLITLYPPQEVDQSMPLLGRKLAEGHAEKQAKAINESTRNKEKCELYLKSIVRRIRDLERPTPFNERLGYFGTLLHYAIISVEKDNVLRLGAWKDFCVQTKNYIEMVGSKHYAIAKQSKDGYVFLDRGKKVPRKKLKLKSHSGPTFQELNIFLGQGPKAM